jgi:hypothetical protein
MRELTIVLAITCITPPTLSAEPTRVMLYGACINGKGSQFAIEPARAKSLPIWRASANTDPPLSASAAMAAAEKHVSRTLGGTKPAPVSSIRLGRSFTEPVIWYYVVDFEEPMASNALVRKSSATVLLDGSIVEPAEVKC